MNDKGPLIGSLLNNIGIVAVSILMGVSVGISKLPWMEKDKASVIYQKFGPNGLKLCLLAIAFLLFVFGLTRSIATIRALRNTS